jgi:hypothetical protein
MRTHIASPPVLAPPGPAGGNRARHLQLQRSHARQRLAAGGSSDSIPRRDELERLFVLGVQVQLADLRRIFHRWRNSCQRSRIDDDDIESWARVQSVRPRVHPPRPDSQLKHLIRIVFPAEQFHRLQNRQAAHRTFAPLSIEQELGSGPVRDVSHLVVDFINENVDRVAAAEFFYEMFLDFIEFSLNSDERRGISPGEMMRREAEINDVEQVRIVIGTADRILAAQLEVVVG